MGTLHLLQATVDLDLDITKFDTAGTSEEYGNVKQEMREKHDIGTDDRVLLSERSPVNPTSIYATSKLAADFLTMNFHDAYGLPTVTTRMFNNYGPRQNPRFITGTIITQALTRDVVELGDLEPKRDMCFVGDGVEGHLHVALEGNAGEQYVYGHGENVSMQEWAEMILAIGAERGHWTGSDQVTVRSWNCSWGSRSSVNRPGGSRRRVGRRESVGRSTGMRRMKRPGSGVWIGNDGSHRTRRSLLG
jgi:dTDP-glucose 4,6-dehydratase